MDELHRTDDADHEDALGLGSVLLLAGFLVRAVQRHRRTAAIGAAATMVMAVIALQVLPPVYRVEARVLTHTAYFIPALVSPTRSIPWQSQAATIGAVELIASRESMSKIIVDANLAERWAATRSGVGRIMDALRRFLLGPLEGEQLQDVLIAILERSMYPSVQGDVISIIVDWPDAETARVLADTTVKVFLAGRQNAELSEIQDTVKILEHNLEASRPALQVAENNLRAVAASRGQIRRIPSRPASPAAAAAGAASGDLSDVRARRAKVQADYDARVTRAQDKVAKLRETLGPSHPDMMSAMRELEEASRPPEELAQLQADEARASMQLNHAGGEASLPPDLEVAVGGGQNDPVVEQAMADYKRARDAFNQVKTRLDDARIEAQTSKAAFGYRYILTQPPLKPSKPVKPRAKVVLGLGFVAALFAGLVLAVLADLLSKRVVEAWMVERFGNLPLLGEIDET